MKTDLQVRKHFADRATQFALDAADRCRAIAGGHGVPANAADNCVDGTVGCPDCPWLAGWSPRNLRIHGIQLVPSPSPRPGPTQ